MARKNKITDDEKAEKYQRNRTKKLKDSTADWQQLQKTAPVYLSNLAKKMYYSILPALQKSDVVKQPDLAVVVALCMQGDILRQAYEDIKKHGIQQAIYKSPISPTGEVGEPEFQGYKKNPAVTTLSDATAKIKQLSSELGLTPQSRATLLNVTDDQDKGDLMAEIAKLIGGKA